MTGTQIGCIVAAIIFAILLCGFNWFFFSADAKVIDGVEYYPYGLFNKAENRDPNVEYRLCKGSVVGGILFSGSIIAPVWCFGFRLYEPVRLK